MPANCFGHESSSIISNLIDLGYEFVRKTDLYHELKLNVFSASEQPEDMRSGPTSERFACFALGADQVSSHHAQSRFGIGENTACQ